MRHLIALFLVVAGAATAQAAPHACASDAIAKAEQLLRLHGEAQTGQPVAVEQEVKILPPVKALKGNGRFDVLEVWGHIYKADYRIRLIYAQIKGSCALMGQEILEASDPY
jgi:5-methylthioribose kinase